MSARVSSAAARSSAVMTGQQRGEVWAIGPVAKEEEDSGERIQGRAGGSQVLRH